jgi:cell division protein FtsB
MSSKLTTYILLALLLVFQGQLWIGRGSVSHVHELERKLSTQEEKNGHLRAQFVQLQADIRDLKEGTNLIEDRARFELGMTKPNEVFVRYAK